MSREAPPRDVLRAFGVNGEPRSLPGGQGTSWAAGHVVLKPESGPCHDWLGTVLANLQPYGVRIAKPVPTTRGAWQHLGWSATERVEGVEPDHTSPKAWLDIVEAGRAFHRAVAHLSHPPLLEERSDPWATADKAAWGERPPGLHTAFTAIVPRLREALEPLGRPQLVHGDLAGNVLFSPGLDPAVVDLSPYWRPRQYAEGIVLADALCWHDAPPSLLREAGVSVAAVARGLLFRVLTTDERLRRGELPDTGVSDEAHRYGAAATAIGL